MAQSRSKCEHAKVWAWFVETKVQLHSNGPAMEPARVKWRMSTGYPFSDMLAKIELKMTIECGSECKKVMLLGMTLLLTGLLSATLASAPEVYTSRFHQSPVRANPGELLVIGGYGFLDDAQVFYRRVDDTNQTPPLPPAT